MGKGKRLYFLSSILASLLFLGSLFLPVLTLYENKNEGGAIVQFSSLTNVIGYFSSSSPWNIVFFSLAFVVVVTGLIFLVIASSVSSEERSDRADKFYVFGCVIVIIGMVSVGMVALLLQSFILMAIALFFSLLYFLFIFLHYKYFTEY